MKIVHVLPSLARGGAERLAIELANRQAAAGHDVAMVIGSKLPTDQVHEGLDAAVQVHHLSAATGRSRYAAMLPWIWRHRGWLCERDILHCHLTYGAVSATVFRALARKGGRPAIVETYHAVGMPISSSAKRFHARLASQWEGLAVMADDPWFDTFRRQNLEVVSRIIPVGVGAPPRVSASAGGEFRRSLGIPENAMVVTTIGRLVAERRSRSYAPIFRQIANQLGHDVHFIIGGEGPERQPIEADAEAAGIRGQVHLPGLIREIELPLAISDLYVTANVGPIPGVAGLQAIAAGVPTIAIQLRDDYLATDEDWIWSSRDASALASRAVTLLTSSSAAEKLTLQQSQHLTATHSPEAMAQNYERLYRDAIAAIKRPA